MSEIFGLGTDIIEVSRINEAIRHHHNRFLERVFTEEEKEYCQKYANASLHFAGRFAAKEAIFKALGTGLQKHIRWHDASIIPDDYGKPVVHLSKHLLTLFPQIHILVSISHTEHYAMATAIVLRNHHGT